MIGLYSAETGCVARKFFAPEARLAAGGVAGGAARPVAAIFLVLGDFSLIMAFIIIKFPLLKFVIEKPGFYYILVSIKI